ncbi:WD repeat-containing protein 16 [Histomonas meleagridis]|uniref:WD repeat-containing protein 16 n=1 Tax=Histomonas meleagridis TaxID=135588 RepID=UPI00355A5E0B|nr:WD repeat-containing protein 16 [Histomonas meleagridis]KAH0804480.1 WD repeat-containing protein 16 [Histomonas meleagridis]
MRISSFRGFIPIHPPCLFISPIDGSVIYPYAKFVVVESKSGTQSFLEGCDEKITCLDMSPKGRMIAAGQEGLRSDVIVWRYSNKSILFRFSEHDGGISCLSFSQDERLLATYGNEGRLIIWDMATGNIVTHHKFNPIETIKWGGRVPDVKGRPTPTFYLATYGSQGISLHIIDPSTGSITTHNLPQGKVVRTVSSFAFTDTHLFCSTESSDVLIFELHSRTLIKILPVGSKGVTYLYTSNDGGILASCGDGTLHSIDLNTSRKIYSCNHPIACIYNDHIITTDGCFISCNAGVVWESNPTTVTSIACCGSVSASSAVDKTVKVWDNDRLNCRLSFTANARYSPTAVALSPNLLIVGYNNGAVNGFDFNTAEKLFEIQHCHHTEVSVCEISPTKRFFATGGCDAAVRIWDIRTREILTHLKNHTMRVNSLKFVPSATHLYSSSDDMSVCLFDLKSEKMINQLTCFDSGVTDIDISDKYLIASTHDGHLMKFCVSQSNDPIMKTKTKEITCMKVSPNGKKIAMGHRDGSVSLWDVETMRKNDEMFVHSFDVTSVRFVSDERVMTAGADGGLSVLEV